MNESPDVDWLAKKTGGLIDFRLEGDPHIIPDDVLSARRRAYMSQIRAQMAAAKGKRDGTVDMGDGHWGPVRHRADRWRDYFGVLDE